MKTDKHFLEDGYCSVALQLIHVKIIFVIKFGTRLWAIADVHTLLQRKPKEAFSELGIVKGELQS